jgi:cobalt-zinc-cadmium efflux system protein
MSLDAVTSDVNLAQVGAFLAARPGVAFIHDLHVWSISTTERALTYHCVMSGGHPGDAYLVRVAQELNQRFGIDHATIQIEVDEHVDCALESQHVV